MLPALERFQPDIILIASGLDANCYDLNSRMNLKAEDYRAFTRMLMDAADRLCGGRLVLIHEGGYSDMYTPYCGLRIVEELSGLSSPVVSDSAFIDNAAGGIGGAVYNYGAGGVSNPTFNRVLFEGLAAESRWDWSRRHPVIRISFSDGVLQSRAEPLGKQSPQPAPADFRLLTRKAQHGPLGMLARRSAHRRSHQLR